MLSVRRRSLLGVLLALAAMPRLAAAKGFFGLSLAVELDGATTNPTLRTIRIVNVLTASPAADAGLRRGDLIVAVEDRLVLGLAATELDGLMQREVGQSLRLRVQRGSAGLFSVQLIAVVARPE